jgi:hypothetical protein
MISSSNRPDTIAFTVVLTACANAGMVADACMVSTLSHARMLKDAVELVNSMPFEPNATVLGALLNGAAEVGDVELGRVVFDQLFKIERKNTENYILMVNLYSNVVKWEEAESIRSMMWGVLIVEM